MSTMQPFWVNMPLNDNCLYYVLAHYLYRTNDIHSETKHISTKESTMHMRDKGASRVYTLRNTTHLPPRKAILTVTRNKVQLIDPIVCEDMAFHKDDFSQRKLVLIGSDPVPVEINRGYHHQTPRHENYAGGGGYRDCATSGRGEGKESACGCGRH